LNLLGAALLQQGRPADGLGCLERAARQLRNNPGVLGNLAQAYFALGRYEDARETFRKASRLDPREPQFQLGNANSLAMQGKLPDAEMLLQRLTQRFPDHPLVWFNYGNVLRDSGRVADALPCFERTLRLAPDFAEARPNLAGVLHAMQRFREAEAQFRACIEQAPEYLLARCNLASVLIDEGRFEEAAAICREVIGLDPAMAVAHTYLGAALGHQGRLFDALECHRVAAELAGHQAKVVETYAATLVDVGRYAEGLRSFQRALAIAPAASSLQMLGTGLLARGSLADGWREYVHRPARQRFLEKYASVELTCELPEDLHGKHVCLLREQGLGDEVFFLRYAARLKAHGARITYRSSNKIRSLFARIGVLDAVIGEADPIPACDHVVLVGDLPLALDILPAEALPPQADPTACMREFEERIRVYWPPVPAPLPLSPLEERLGRAREALAAAGPPPYLGITWRGGTPPQEQQGAGWVLYKEIGIERLAAAVASFPGTVLALQRAPRPAEVARFAAALGRPVAAFSAYNEDLEDMLALLALIDEYVGVSNTNMHLRAVLGKATRVLVPCPAEWRWMCAGARSPWFPEFPIYRQSAQGDWSHALAALNAELEAAHPARA
jgi:tetratricopeptide (TPR) repeat protein